MTFHKACTLDELWEGDMTEVEVEGHVIVLVRPEGASRARSRASVRTRTFRSRKASSTAAC